jgi:hypothetical protein
MDRKSGRAEISVGLIDGPVLLAHSELATETPAGKPVGIWMYSTFLREPSLLGFAYDLEQELKPRRMPKFLSSVPPLPPDAGICDMLPKPNQSQAGLTHLRRHWGTNKPITGSKSDRT